MPSLSEVSTVFLMREWFDARRHSLWGGAISGNPIGEACRHSDVLAIDRSFAKSACFLHREAICMNFSELTPCPRGLRRSPCLFESALIKVYRCGIV